MGGYSQIKTEIDLLKTAIPKRYQYYHLLSGADLPLKSQEYIHKFFSVNQGKEFIQLGTKDYIRSSEKRYKYYWFFQEKLGNGKKNILYKILNKLRYGIILLQYLFKIDRTQKNIDIFKCYYSGAQWFSITHNFAKYVVSKELQIKKVFNRTICCDEVFLQTLLMNSEFKNNIYYHELDGNYISIMRKIDWDRGNPYIWKKEDYEELINSDFLFARKFSEEKDEEIVDIIFNKLYQK